MIVKLTKEAIDDIEKLGDEKAKRKVRVQLDRLEMGNPGDVKAVGEGVSEIRIHYGSGYRIYFFQHQDELVIVACVGDKATQKKDIERARRIKKRLYN